MTKSERFGLVLTPGEKKAAQRLAEEDGVTSAAIVRRMIRLEAQRRGLWRAQGEKQEVCQHG